ncbi:MAG: efflux transporter outer membrane subunit [Armatimonadetes bacterium]|nr:efflux transporter outer membrane subunit [Akkermansiaceae bacterium]
MKAKFHTISYILFLPIVALALFSSSCKPVGPDHQVPASEGAAAYKNSSSAYSSGIGGRWWRIFDDGKLNSLMTSLEGGNFDLRAAEARRNQAYALLGIDRSLQLPQVFTEASLIRNRGTESDRGGGGVGGGGLQTYFTNYRVGLSLAYEVDLWGRVRRLVEAGEANTNAAEISVDQVRLSLQAQLARNYLALRFLDTEADVLSKALKTREETLELARDRFEGGKTSELDVARAESELAATRSQLVSLQAPRAALENAIALLAGKNPSNLSIPPVTIDRSAPGIAAGSPAQLLGRRPDVFVAERRLAASSAQIGVAEANFYPRISLIATGGLSSIDPSDFLKWSSREFSIGPQIDLPLFQGARRKADYAVAVARHEEALANYQQTVLGAFVDVENALATRRAANNEISAQQDSILAAEKSFELSDIRYKEGISSYLEVVDSQRELLNARRGEVQARGRAFGATVQLIQALGGGFSK